MQASSCSIRYVSQVCLKTDNFLCEFLHWQTTNLSTWTIGKIKKNVSPSLSGRCQLQPSAAVPEDSPPVLLEFTVPNTTVSGLAVETLLITNERYKPYKGVKTLTKAGKFQFRVS